jgi:glutathione S-transferase
MSIKPLTLHGAGSTPNPIKVAILLEELGVPYTVHTVDIMKGETKQEPFISLNPNGRLPALEDPNTGVTLFEVSQCSQLV